MAIETRSEIREFRLKNAFESLVDFFDFRGMYVNVRIS